MPSGPRGVDGHKKGRGIKRHVLRCALGFVLAVLVTADANGLQPLPLCWRIEATFGTPSNRWRHLTRNLEQSPAAAEDAVAIANCHRLLRAYTRPEYITA